MKLSVSEELRGKRFSLIRAVIRSSSGVPATVTMETYTKHNCKQPTLNKQ